MATKREAEKQKPQKTTMYLDADLWREFRARAIADGYRGATEVLTQLMRDYLGKSKPKRGGKS